MNQNGYNIKCTTEMIEPRKERSPWSLEFSAEVLPNGLQIRLSTPYVAMDPISKGTYSEILHRLAGREIKDTFAIDSVVLNYESMEEMIGHIWYEGQSQASENIEQSYLNELPQNCRFTIFITYLTPAKAKLILGIEARKYKEKQQEALALFNQMWDQMIPEQRERLKRLRKEKQQREQEEQERKEQERIKQEKSEERKRKREERERLKKEQLEREACEREEQERFEKERLEQEEKQRVDWRAMGCCEVCGTKLAFLERLVHKRCKQHRAK